MLRSGCSEERKSCCTGLIIYTDEEEPEHAEMMAKCTKNAPPRTDQDLFITHTVVLHPRPARNRQKHEINRCFTRFRASCVIFSDF